MEETEATILCSCNASACKWWRTKTDCMFRGIAISESGKCMNYFNPGDFVQYTGE